MSLILEALRKSEAERRRGQMPGVHSQAPSAPSAGRRQGVPVIGWGLAALVVLIVVGSAVALLQHAPDVPAVAEPMVRNQPAAPAPSPLPAVAHLSGPVAVTPAGTAPPPARATPAMVPSRQAPATVAPPVATAALKDVAKGDAAAGMPDVGALRLSDLSPDERKALPPLKLSMHMWNDDPSRRFVILDGSRRREGDRIGNAVIIAITIDGVVLDWNGRTLKLPIR